MICTSSVPLIRDVSVVFLAWRIVDVLATDIKISLFDHYAKRPKRYVYSWPSRVIILGFINYLELIICFAGIYAFDVCLLTDSTQHLGWIVNETAEKALHLSLATQVTVGYGDIVPTGWLRSASWAQMFAGLIVIVLLVGRYLALLPSGGSPFQTIDKENEGSRSR